MRIPFRMMPNGVVNAPATPHRRETHAVLPGGGEARRVACRTREDPVGAEHPLLRRFKAGLFYSCKLQGHLCRHRPSQRAF